MWRAVDAIRQSSTGAEKPAAYIIEKCIEANIRPFFGAMKVAKLQTSDFERYRAKRAQAVSDATVDHDFTYLKSALLLEYKKTPSRIARVPHIPKSGEDNVRHGFLEFEGYELVLEEFPVSLKPVFVVGYHVGNRKGALLELKKGHGGRRGMPGSQIKSFYDSWRSAVKRAGFPSLFHDLRRSAVRNMVEKIGVSEKRAMEISGHKTRSCFERYHIGVLIRYPGKRTQDAYVDQIAAPHKQEENFVSSSRRSG